ncbi:uncharacterized protein MYCFIDRAFT_86151 [Pseudocercospora fijiensis CIRAD86]|uniref:Cell wall mannoprotein PIR1-like C-terminal domain-containing protein n=1 Tax=Pseudocercospora fijiensis (strain CIRAD86) TaxID=383855 RepID=N1QC80_PSEFD|nr:uncharacterized protein MYCFIDRAFT_86151 [Pseudocercospora fijiensis CIRAD86]EME88948.1 hypothetical protein MYCFIDRAFT_86151 [Pseudocercospora fijiensis CIRAD86]
MRYSIAPVALAALAAANPTPQGVTAAISPSTSSPAGCKPDYSGTFQIQVVNVTSTGKRDVEKRASGALYLTLAGGILKDQDGRTGYIAANRQFQFDKPAQTGAIYTAGWSACANNTLAIGGDAVFAQCLSGTFYNLYDEATSAQCSPVYIEIINGGSSTGSAPATAASELPDGQITATPVAPVHQIPDGQIQATTGSPVGQISDGQVQATSPVAPVTQITDGQIQAPTSRPVSPVTQISDGQVQAPTNGSAIATATPTVQPYTGAAVLPTMRAELFGLAAGVLAVVML